MIVYSPSDVLLTGMKTIAPPRILMRFRTKMPESVGVSRLRKSIHPRPLFGKIAGIFFVGFRVCKVYGFVSYVVVPAKDYIISFFLDRIAEFEDCGTKVQLVV